MANGNPIVLGQSDTSTKQTTVTAITPSTDEGLRVQNVKGTGMAAGSVSGTALEAGSIDGAAILAESFGGTGIVATCRDSRDVPAISVAIQGNVARGFGVLGVNARGPFPESGVAGVASRAIGVDGRSSTRFGVRGVTNGGTNTAAGVLAVGSPGTGLVAIGTPGFFAGLFLGKLQVQGDFLVTGFKAAVVPHPDGSHRRLYCVEAPESWFEDFGAAALVKGLASVALEKTFAELVARTDYHVFLTPEGDCRGLYVARKNRNGFEVRELQGGGSSVPFSYRIAARRRDIKGERLAKVDLASVPEHPAAIVTKPKAARKRPETKLVQGLRTLARRGASKRAPG